jgi:hypothetical protein
MKNDYSLSERIEYHRKRMKKSDFSLGYVQAVDDIEIAVKVVNAYKKMPDDPKFRAFRKGHMAFVNDAKLKR